jgi:hypothetical protein
VRLGLAAAFHVDPIQNAGEADLDYYQRVTHEMLQGLEPGAMLQFWDTSDGYEALKTRTGAAPGIGHSPFFIRNRPAAGGGLPDGMVVIDQFGETDCPLQIVGPIQLIKWGGYLPEIWIAANWDE